MKLNEELSFLAVDFLVEPRVAPFLAMTRLIIRHSMVT